MILSGLLFLWGRMMDRFDTISMRVAFEVLSKERPSDAFGAS